MIVRMKKHVTGTRNGQEWPQVGGTVDVPEHEALDLCAAGLAEVAHGVTVVDGFRPVGDAELVDQEPVPDGSIKDVVEWVGDDVARAQRALDAELEFEKPRKGLVTPLEDLIAEAEAEAELAAEEAADAEADNGPGADGNSTAAGDAGEGEAGSDDGDGEAAGENRASS